MADNASNKPHETPRKARVKGAIDYMEARGILHFKVDVFRFNGVSKTRGWEMLKNDNELDDRQHHNSMQEHRGRKPILSAKDLLNVEKYPQEEG